MSGSGSRGSLGQQWAGSQWVTNVEWQTSYYNIRMPLMGYALYSMGLMPSEDVDAQRRCYAYLEKLVARLEKEKKSNLELKAAAEQLKSVQGLVQAAAGSRRYDRAKTFWTYWDRNKNQIISMCLGTSDDYRIQNEMGRLEEGRYWND